MSQRTIKIRNPHLNRGAFTLVELIVSMLIFTIFVGVVASTFIFITRALQEANQVRRVYGEARAIMDRVTQDVRLYTVDYACLENRVGYASSELECTVGPALTLLPLVSSDGLHRVVYRFEAEEEGEGGVLSLYALDWDAAGESWMPSEGFYEGFQNFMTRHVQMEDVSFTIAPLTSPYAEGASNESQYQPSVHVVIQAKGALSRLDEVIPVKLQSTISSRVYTVTF